MPGSGSWRVTSALQPRKVSPLERAILVRTCWKDNALVENYNRRFGGNLARLKKRVEEFAPLIETAEAHRLIDQLQTAVTEIQENHEELIVGWRMLNWTRPVKFYNEKTFPRFKEIGQTAERLTQQQSELMAVVSSSAEASAA